MQARSFQTPLGPVTATEDAGAIVRLDWADGCRDDTPLLRAAETQLAAYFAGTRTVFDLPLRIDASLAQQAVCAAMVAIPLGETRTYGELARDLGLSAQAVGQLCGGNPIPIVVPCHRVLGASTLGGFSAPGGVETKVWLLRHERAAGLLI
jgi:methylated-DNA-[protein]-cysteine S-methyltransferase